MSLPSWKEWCHRIKAGVVEAKEANSQFVGTIRFMEDADLEMHANSGMLSQMKGKAPEGCKQRMGSWRC